MACGLAFAQAVGGWLVTWNDMPLDRLVTVSVAIGAALGGWLTLQKE